MSLGIEIVELDGATFVSHLEQDQSTTVYSRGFPVFDIIGKAVGGDIVFSNHDRPTIHLPCFQYGTTAMSQQATICLPDKRVAVLTFLDHQCPDSPSFRVKSR